MSTRGDVRHLVALIEAAGDRDALVRLGVLDELRQALDLAEAAAILDARARGYTWREIAYWSGLRTRQAAHARARRLAVRSDH